MGKALKNASSALIKQVVAGQVPSDRTYSYAVFIAESAMILFVVAAD